MGWWQPGSLETRESMRTLQSPCSAGSAMFVKHFEFSAPGSIWKLPMTSNRPSDLQIQKINSHRVTQAQCTYRDRYERVTRSQAWTSATRLTDSQVLRPSLNMPSAVYIFSIPVPCHGDHSGLCSANLLPVPRGGRGFSGVCDVAPPLQAHDDVSNYPHLLHQSHFERMANPFVFRHIRH